MAEKNSIFEHLDYKDFVHERLKKMPKQGHGQLKRIAEHLNISSVSVSHIFNGPRDLSEEQAVELCEFLGLGDLESEYFSLLVRHERAGTHKLKLKLKAKIDKLKIEAQDLKSRLTQDIEVDEAAKSQFYSNWYYSGIRLATALDDCHSVDGLAQSLGLSRTRVREVIDFLLKFGLVVEKNGDFVTGPKRTHLSAGSPLISRHHTNWRLKGITRMESISPEELFYSGPMTLSFETMKEIRKEVVDLIDRVVKKIEPSPPELLACLNIDWFQVNGRS
jgi:uncharacterized protein (TIGR02147 family)